MDRVTFLARLRERRAAGAVSAPCRTDPARASLRETDRARVAPAPPAGDLTALFVERLGELGARGRARRLAAEAWPAKRSSARRRRAAGGASRCAPGLAWEGIAAHWTAEAREGHLGLSEADWAVAETGAVVVCASAEVRRGYSLVPPAAAFFVPASASSRALATCCASCRR